MRKVVLVGLVFILLSVLLPRLVDLRGGLILGEPDEVVHAKLVESLLTQGRPVYRDVGFYFDLPAYFLVASWFSRFVFNDPLVSLRYVSLLSAILTSLILFYYLKIREGSKAAIIGSVFYFLIPLTVFYLRVGIIEPFLILSLTGSFVFFDLALNRNDSKFSLISGFFLGLGFLTKYSILPVFLTITLFFLVDFIRQNRHFLKSDELHLSKISFPPLLITLLIFLPVFLFFYFQDPVNVKWQTKQIFGFTGEVSGEFRPERLLDFPWWFSFPVIFLSLVGLFRLLKDAKKWSFFLICLFLLLFSTLTRLPFYPRYLLLLAPFISILSAQGSSLIPGRKAWLVLFFTVIFNLPFLFQVYVASRQMVFEEAVSFVKQKGFTPAWVFSNYWPNYFADFLGVSHYSWVTYSSADIDSFAKGEQRDTITILNQEGGAVFLEKTFADLYLTQSKSRLTALSDLPAWYPLTTSITSEVSNFPFTRQRGNRIDIYLIEPKNL